MTEKDIEAIVAKTITATLSRFGIEEGDHKELMADLGHLRRWRKSVEQAQSYSFKIVITTIVSGVVGALWLGFQAMLHK
jgi:hypothetical protein